MKVLAIIKKICAAGIAVCLVLILGCGAPQDTPGLLTPQPDTTAPPTTPFAGIGASATPAGTEVSSQTVEYSFQCQSVPHFRSSAPSSDKPWRKLQKKVVVIRSVSQLKQVLAQYGCNRADYPPMYGEDVMNNTEPHLLQALEMYDDAYFENKILLFTLVPIWSHCCKYHVQKVWRKGQTVQIVLCGVFGVGTNVGQGPDYFVMVEVEDMIRPGDKVQVYAPYTWQRPLTMPTPEVWE
nr:hypothetical protein [bacterium]